MLRTPSSSQVKVPALRSISFLSFDQIFRSTVMYSAPSQGEITRYCVVLTDAPRITAHEIRHVRPTMSSDPAKPPGACSRKSLPNNGLGGHRIPGDPYFKLRYSGCAVKFPTIWEHSSNISYATRMASPNNFCQNTNFLPCIGHADKTGPSISCASELLHIDSAGQRALLITYRRGVRREGPHQVGNTRNPASRLSRVGLCIRGIPVGRGNILRTC
jgi:hypothetical protein